MEITWTDLQTAFFFGRTVDLALWRAYVTTRHFIKVSLGTESVSRRLWSVFYFYRHHKAHSMLVTFSRCELTAC